MTTEQLKAANQKAKEIAFLRDIEQRLLPDGPLRPDDAACLSVVPYEVRNRDAKVIMAFIRNIYQQRREQAEAEFANL